MDPDSGWRWVFILFITIPSFGFFLLWLAKVKDQILVVIFKTNRTLWKVLTLGLINQERFVAEYVDRFHGHNPETKPRAIDETPDGSQMEDRYDTLERRKLQGTGGRSGMYLTNDMRDGDFELSKNIS